MSAQIKCRPTKQQMKLLVELLALDPQLMAGKFSSTFTQKQASARWDAEKTWCKWKKAWQDTKATAKSKASAIKRHGNGTGGGPPCNITMSEVQLNAIAQISDVAVTGHTDSSESAVEIIYDHDHQLEDSQNIDQEIIEINLDNELMYEVLDSSPKPVNTAIIPPPLVSINQKQNLKKNSKSKQLDEHNSAANKLANIAEQKLELKKEYYAKKLKLMDEQTIAVNNLNNVLSSFLKNQ
ncbi:uncharacterized protein LOC126555368 [Aphis gossypii]|uniref:uncharacterized protein LOC114125703 n=1 Tax=Aphis gossypii TaxID=80765 RepID=UPI0021593296|nr:uncharacterized protein LOC114125703 [Aphis gossypii]XP_050066254.1 uncharacterized protein LOC126555368 [Aphis gossypii]